MIEGGSEWDFKCALGCQPVAVFIKADESFFRYTHICSWTRRNFFIRLSKTSHSYYRLFLGCMEFWMT